MKYSTIVSSFALAATAVSALPLPGPAAQSGAVTVTVTVTAAAAQGTAAGGAKGKKHHKGKKGKKGKSGKGNTGGSNSSVTGNNSTAAAGAVGAAFFITNEPAGNQVVVNLISSDGKVSFAGMVPTGGNGAHGVTDPANGPDPLFTQGAVKVIGNMLFAVNAGSNTLSMFNIDLNSPQVLTMVGKPVDTAGEFPVSVAVSKAVNQVCALNGGAKNGVACFTPDPAKGLTPVANTIRNLGLNQTTPANGPAGTASHVIFSEDGSKLIASIKGVPPTPGILATFAVAADGSLSSNFTASTPATGGLLPFSMSAIPGTNAILNTDAGVGFSVFDFGDPTSLTATSSVVPIQGQKATCWSSFSKKTGNLYLTDIGTSIVTEVNVAQNLTGSVVAQFPQGAGTASIDNDIASIGNNDFLYVLLANATTIAVSSLDAPGKVTALQKLNVSEAASAAGATGAINPQNVQGMTIFIADAGNAASASNNSSATSESASAVVSATASEVSGTAASDSASEVASATVSDASGTAAAVSAATDDSSAAVTVPGEPLATASSEST